MPTFSGSLKLIKDQQRDCLARQRTFRQKPHNPSQTAQKNCGPTTLTLAKASGEPGL